MPYSKKQKKLFCADYGRAKAGKKTRTGMSKEELRKHCKMKVKIPGASVHEVIQSKDPDIVIGEPA